MHYIFLQLEHQLAGGLAALNVGMSTTSISQGVHIVDANNNTLVLDHVEQLSRVLLKLRALNKVVVDNGAHETDILGSKTEQRDALDSTRLDATVSTNFLSLFFLVAHVLTALPNEIKLPLRAIISKSRSNVDLPIPSKMASTPWPFVIFFTSAATSSVDLTV